MIQFSFSKYEGAGNDFILIDDRASFFPTNDSALIQKLCHRRFGIGADGVLLLQNDKEADARMRIFNSDGSEAEGCGNGVRCLMRFLEGLAVLPVNSLHSDRVKAPGIDDLEQACIKPIQACSRSSIPGSFDAGPSVRNLREGPPGWPRRPYRIAVGAKILFADFLGDSIRVEMGILSEWNTHLIDGREIHFVNSGVPHAVWFVPEVEKIPLHEVGSLLRRHPVFGLHGTNVNIATIVSESCVQVRTFERGVEGETLACGTGATAVAAIGAKLFGWKSPVRIRYPGGELDIYFDSSLEKVSMAGPARKVFAGNWFF